MRTLRKGTRGWTQARLAQESGLSRNYIADIECGRSANPSRQALRRLAAALGVTLADLIELEPDSEQNRANSRIGSEPTRALMRFFESEFYAERVARLAEGSGVDSDEMDGRMRELLRLLPRPLVGLTAADYRAVVLFLCALVDS